MRIKAIHLLLAVAVLMSGCARQATEEPPTSDAIAASESLQETVEGYFDEYLELNPTYATHLGDHRWDDRFPNSIGPEWRAASLELEERYLVALDEIDRSQLASQDLLTYDIFRRDRDSAIEGFEYPTHLIPISQLGSVPNGFVRLGSGRGSHPFQTVEDYDNFLSRIEGFVEWMDQAVNNMREGTEQGVVQPQVLMEKVLPQLQSQIVDDPEQSLFWQPIANLPDEVSDEDRERLTAAYRQAIAEKLVPAYQRVHAFIRDDYLPECRSTVGLDAQPNGKAWYAYLVREHTTTELSPEEIHRIGLAEVERIHREMEKVREEVGFEGDLQAFFAYLNDDPRFYFEQEEELLNGYRALRESVHAAALDLFARFPKADYEIRPLEAFLAKSSGNASYQSPSPDGSRPGVFRVNTYDLSARPKWFMESTFLHEAVPGHHLQKALKRELEELPRFRRFGGYGVFSEGWGLYAESLGKELGAYQDPYQYFGALYWELWRSLRLLVDTGLHAKGWTREQVLEYMYANTPVKETEAVAEAERYIANPGQALAYKIGQLEIRKLRTRAEEALGDGFDIKLFHAQVLEDGELPLDVLAAKIERWIEEQG